MAGTTTFYGVSYPTSTDLVKDGATAIQTVATGFDSAVAIPTYNAQTGATYTFVLSDTGKTVTASNASAQTYTIPPTASVAWTANTSLKVINLGAGVVTFAAGAGVTVTNTAQTLAQFASATLIRTGLNAWTVTPTSGGASGLTLVSATTIGTTVSSVNVTGAFSSTYDNYKIFITGGVASTDNAINLKMGATTTGYYAGRLRVLYVGGTLSQETDNNAASWTNIGYGNTNSLHANFELLNPFKTQQTNMTNIAAENATSARATMTSGWLNNSTSYTDFTLTPSGGTLTGGTIRVYGYQNS